MFCSASIGAGTSWEFQLVREGVKERLGGQPAGVLKPHVARVLPSGLAFDWLTDPNMTTPPRSHSHSPITHFDRSLHSWNIACHSNGCATVFDGAHIEVPHNALSGRCFPQSTWSRGYWTWRRWPLRTTARTLWAWVHPA